MIYFCDQITLGVYIYIYKIEIMIYNNNIINLQEIRLKIFKYTML